MLIDQFEGEIAWKYRHPMIVGRVYKAKAGTNPTLFQCTITELKYLEGQDGTTRLAAKTLLDGQKGVVNLQLEPGFESNLDVVGLPIELLEMDSEESLASCTLHFPLRRSSNIRWQAMSINREARETMMQQKGKCIWFTGLSGSGKSTIASAFEQHLFQQGRFTMTLDGDNVRHGLNKDLGFTETDRVENIRANAEHFGVAHRLTALHAMAQERMESLPAPDAVFIGGGGDAALHAALWPLMPQGCRIVANGVTLETEAVLADLHHRHGGQLLRLDLAEATPLGRFRDWRAARPVVQWRGVK